MTARFTLAEVLAATRGECNAQGTKLDFEGVCTDTRTLKPGVLYIALSGERFDGHDYVQEATRLGAAGVIVSQPVTVETGATVVVVANTRIALQDLARFHRCRFQLPLIAVTGSNGKTSTKDMIAAVLSMKLNVLRTEANFNNEIGLSQTLLQLDGSHQAAVVEMGMRGRGEIAELASIALPTIGVVTNVGETHLERLGTVENIAAAKAELIEVLPVSGFAVLNADDQFVQAMQQKTAAQIRTFAVDAAADIQATDIVQTIQGVSFECREGENRFPAFVPLPGRHTIYNALAAIAAGRLLGLDFAQIAAGLADYQPGKMRLNIRRQAEITIIDDTYNASPLSMAAAINVLGEIAPGRKIAVIGDMLELGEASRQAHERVGQQLADVGAAIILTVGEMAGYTAAAATLHGVADVVACKNHQQAVGELQKRLLPGDTLLVKGSRGMQMEKVLTVFAPASEG